MFNAATVGPWSLWYIAGKGDWKHKVAWLQESRSYSHSAICRRCRAAHPNWTNITFRTDWYINQAEAVDSAIGDIPSLAWSSVAFVL